MKCFSSILFSASLLLPVALGVAIAEPKNDFDLMKRQSPAESYLPGVLPDGKSYISLFEDDVLVGTIVEGNNSEPISYDAFGELVVFDDDDGDDDDNDDDDSHNNNNDKHNNDYYKRNTQGSRVLKRQRATLLAKFSGFIAEYGSEAWVSENFL